MNQTSPFNPQRVDDKELLDRKLNYKMSYIAISFIFGFGTLSELAILYFLKDIKKIEPVSLSIVEALNFFPWAIKPLFGFITDLNPIYGYRRKPYIIAAGLIATIGWLYLFFFYATLGIADSVFTLFIISSCMSFSSVLGEALVVELSMMESVTAGEDLSKNYVSLFFFFKNFGGMMAALLKGVLVEYIGIRHVFLTTALVPACFTICGIFLKEKRIDTTQLELDPHYQEMSKETYFKTFFDFICQKHIVIPSLFILLILSIPSYSDPMFYYSTNILLFTPTQMGLISMFGYAGTMLAIVAYRYYFKFYSFKQIMIGSDIIYFIFSFFSYCLIRRYNLLIGIPDFVFIAIYYSMISLISEIMLLPMLSLACVLCPKNLEASVYAYFLSLVNVGMLISMLFGASLTWLLGINSTNYTNLPTLVLMANGLILLPIIWLVCIKNSYFNPQIKKEEDELSEKELSNNANTMGISTKKMKE